MFNHIYASVVVFVSVCTLEFLEVKAGGNYKHIFHFSYYFFNSHNYFSMVEIYLYFLSREDNSLRSIEAGLL